MTELRVPTLAERDEHQRVAAERDILAAGLRALVALDRHAEDVVGDHPADPRRCVSCAQFVVALLRNRVTADAVHLRCEQARQWQMQFDEAWELIRRES